MEDLINIEIAIELDRGKSIHEVAKDFKVKTSYVRDIAQKTFFGEKRITKTKKRRYTNLEKSVLIERIKNGELLKEIAIEEVISESTLRRWCKLSGIIIPRRIENISDDEGNEIRDLLEIYDWQEISKTYNITKETIEALKNPPHSKLNSDTLSYLFELLRENPHSSVNSICRIMKEAGFVVMAVEVNSYKKRLISLKII